MQVIADSSANAVFVAADLLSQAEHGVDSQVVLLAVDITDEHLELIKEEVHKQALALPRVDIVRQCIRQSLILRLPTREDALQFSNDYAPEHLILHLTEAATCLEHIRNAGSVFVGKWSPESCVGYGCGSLKVRLTVLLHTTDWVTMPAARTTPFRPVLLPDSTLEYPPHLT